MSQAQCISPDGFCSSLGDEEFKCHPRVGQYMDTGSTKMEWNQTLPLYIISYLSLIKLFLPFYPCFLY